MLKHGNIKIVVTTQLGDIELDLNPVEAPNTTANFLKYVDSGHYNGGRFHRTVTSDNQSKDAIQIEVIQTSVNSKFRNKGFGPIELERTSRTGLEHLDGTQFPEFRHFQLLLHRRPAGTRLRRQTQP